MAYFRYCVLLLYAAFLFVGCRKPDFYYSTNGIYLSNYDNSGDFIRARDSAARDAYVMRINYTSTITNYSSVNQDDTYEGTNAPTSIDVITLQSFDSTHPVNSSVADCFINGPGSTSVNDVISNFGDTKNWYPTHESDDLWLMKPPDNPGLYSFIVTMGFNDGVTVSDTTSVRLY